MKFASLPLPLHLVLCRIQSPFLQRLLCWLLVLALPLAALPQSIITVKGRVTGAGNEGLPHASVVVKGSSSGVNTNDNGEYTIQVPDNATLVFSFTDYILLEVKVNKRTLINVELTRSRSELQQVVVVGYGTQRKRDVTGAIVSVDEKALREVPVANLQQALQGRAAGLEIQRAGNQPGAGAQIRIRGSRSISGSNEPLFVVDGIPFEGTLNDLNPDDVASIDILKDASSTAIYGSRGANGVIIVTTKKGRNGETRVSYNGYYGIGKVFNKYPVFNATEYQAMRNLSTWGQGYMPEEINGINAGRNTDWQGLLYQNARRTNHNISVTGGNAGNTFALGGSYYNETALMPGEDFTRYAIRAAIDTRIGKRFKVGLTTLNAVNINNGSQFVSGSAIFRMLANSPLMPPYNPDGSLYLIPNGNLDDNNGNGRYSPLLLKNQSGDRWVDKIRRLRTINNLYAEVEIMNGLRYRVNLGLNYAQEQSAQFQGSDQPKNPSFFRPAQGNTARVGNGEAWGYTLENLLYYDKTIGKHKINFTGLYSIQESQTFNNFVQKDSITEDFVQFYNLALSTPVTSQNTSLGGNESRSSLLSYMGRINYSFDERFLLTLTGRIDGSSRLAPGNRWFTYPAISAGWIITNEKFMQGINAISNLKVRAGWGKTSNQAINPYASLGLVSNNNGLPAGQTNGNVIRYNYGPTIVSGFQVINLPNPSLKWEFTNTTNIGIDFGLFNNRITGSIEYYNAQTNDVLYDVVLPVTSGVAGPYTTNIGKIENKGFELSVSALVYRSNSGFSWNTDFNLFFNRNKVLRLSNGVTTDIANQLHVGYPLSAIYDYKKLGIWQISEAAEAARYGALPGQLKLEDHSGPNGKPDGQINTLDQYVIGNGDARLQGGMTHRFSFRGFDLSVVLYARFGGLLISQIHQPNASYLTTMDGRRNGLKVDYWTPTNPSNWFPMPQQSISPQSTAWTTLGYYNASFVKVRSINLGYTLTNAWLQRIRAESVRIYLMADNVGVLFSPYYKQTGIDPEGTGVGAQGVSDPGNIRNNQRGNGTITIGASTPPRRTFSVGASIVF